MLVSLDRASDWLRRDTTADDAMLSAIIEGASGAVANYLKSADWMDSDLQPQAVDSDGVATDVPAVVQTATLILVGVLYDKTRNGNADKEFEQGYLPAPVTALLYPLRDPALA